DAYTQGCRGAGHIGNYYRLTGERGQAGGTWPVAGSGQRSRGQYLIAFPSEAELEASLLQQLRGLGYSIEREEDIGPDGHWPERESHDEVVLRRRFEDAVARLNPGVPPEARQDAIRRVTQSELPALLEENRPLHRLMTEGVDVEYYADDGTLTAGKVALLDFEHPENNDWL